VLIQVGDSQGGRLDSACAGWMMGMRVLSAVFDLQRSGLLHELHEVFKTLSLENDVCLRVEVNPYESPQHAVVETPPVGPSKPILQQLLEISVALIFLLAFAYGSVPVLRFAKKRQTIAPTAVFTSSNRTSAR